MPSISFRRRILPRQLSQPLFRQLVIQGCARKHPPARPSPSHYFGDRDTRDRFPTRACSRLAPASHSTAVIDNKEATPLQKKALASLGRNVLHFQRVETLLKQLVLLCDFSAPVSGFAARHAERKEELRTTTMGSLVNELHRQLYGSLPEPESEQALTEIVMRVGLKIEADPNYIARQKLQLSALVLERNCLIHQDLATFDPASAESCRHWITRLDEQNERILTQHQALRQVLDTHHQMLRESILFVGSQEIGRPSAPQQNP